MLTHKGTNLTDHILLPREERVSHTDLCEPCECVPRKTQNNKRLFKRLLELLSIENDVLNRKRARIEVCHLCESRDCENPKHAYLGTCSENSRDIPAEVRSETARRRESGLTSEQKRVRAQKGEASLTKNQREQRRDRARKTMAERLENTTPEQRSENARRREASKTRDQRRKSALTAARVRLRGVQLSDPNGEVYIFESLVLAGKTLGLCPQQIGKVCRGENKTTRGYTATYWDG